MSGRPLTIVSLALGLALLLTQPIIGSFSVPSPHPVRHATATTTAQHAAIATDYGHLPLAFELNAGQVADPAVRFLTHGAGYALALTPSAALLALAQPSGATVPARPPFAQLSQLAMQPAAARTPLTILGMRWLGANPHPVVTGEQPLPGTVNYFLGNNPKQWHTNIPTYQQVRLHNVYPGVDLVYYGTGGQLEYDFVVAPGANPTAIQLGFSGAQGVGVDLLGNLSLSLPGGTIAQAQPLVYQQINGARQPIAGGYTLASGGRVGFALGAYNPRLPLVIDPSYKFSTYLSGSNNDYGSSIAVDASGNAYITGDTLSDDFPTSVGAFQTSNTGGEDVFVTKLNAAGSALVYSTYLGGTSDDYGNGIAVDTSGDAYITGVTNSTNFPVANAFQGSSGGSSDALVAKLNAAGNALMYSTYLGGGSVDVSYAIAVDSGGNAYVTGVTGSTNFPTLNALQSSNGGSNDVFVSKFAAVGSLVYSTYLGGSNGDVSYGIAVDSGGNAYVTGITTSTNFPTQSPLQANAAGSDDAFVSKLNASGSALVYSTYLGGSNFDEGIGIAVDSGGNAYVTGVTSSTNFPTNPPGGTSNGGDDAFVSKLNASGSALVYSTYLGGSNTEEGNGIAVDSGGDAYVTGYTQSTDFLLVNPLRNSLDGGQDAFITKLNAAGSLPIFSTYLGGNGNDTGNGIAVGVGGTVYVTGVTLSTDFPTVNALQPSVKGIGSAVFITKMATLPTPVFTPGVFRPSSATFYLHNSNVSGVADEGATFGAGTDVPVVGDWTGKGYDSIGVFRNGSWFLRNSNTTGGANISLAFGAAGDMPVVGDWTGKGYDSVGIFRPSTGTFYLRNSNTTGGADITVQFGTTGDLPVVGDWTGKGYDSIGIYRPSVGAFFLRNSNTVGGPNLIVFFGASGDKPVVGDWTGQGKTTIGVYRTANETFYLRNSNTGSIYADLSVVYGASGDKPLVGQWILQPGSSKPFRRGPVTRQPEALPIHPAAARRDV